MKKSGPGRPTDPSKDREILAAGRALMFELGPMGVTMEAVARNAGVAKPTLYRRFPNRDALLSAIAGSEAETMSACLEIMPGSADDIRQALVDFGSDLSTFLSSNEHLRFIHALGAAVGIAQSARDSIYRSGPLNARNRLAAWFVQLDKKSLLACRDAEYSAEQFFGMLMGMDLIRTLYHVTSGRDETTRTQRIGLVVDDFLALHKV